MNPDACYSMMVFMDAYRPNPSYKNHASGGILSELVSSLPNSVGTSTCSQKGYSHNEIFINQRGKSHCVFGYDESINKHGAWTETNSWCFRIAYKKMKYNQYQTTPIAIVSGGRIDATSVGGRQPGPDCIVSRLLFKIRWTTQCPGRSTLVRDQQTKNMQTKKRDPWCGFFARIGNQSYNTNEFMEPSELPRGVLFAKDILGI